MKLTTILAAIMASLALAGPLPTPKNFLKPYDPNDLSLDFTSPAKRSLLEDMQMKGTCKSTFKSDKSKYKTACEGVASEDKKNLCMLRALLGDASVECRSAMVKSIDF
jgi:hypothetical protein